MRNAFFLLALFFLVGCSAGPRPIRYGEDECAHCRMRIMDPRFGAEAVTAKGRQMPMDSAECLVEWLAESNEAMRSLWVTDYAGKQLISAETALYLQSEHLPSPMGGGISAYATRAAAEQALQEYPGRVLDWTELKAVGMEVE